VLEAICVTAVKLLKATGSINGETYGVDGTKIESASGRYLFVWKQSIEQHKRKLDEQRRTSITIIDGAWEDENGE
jgi:hypothetical protein